MLKILLLQYTQERQADFWTGYNPIPVERESPTFTRQIYDTSIGFMQTVQTIAMPLAYAYKVIGVGVGGANIEYIWRRTGATVSFWLGDAAFDEMILEIRGTSSQVQEARGLIEVRIYPVFIRFDISSMIIKTES